MNIFCRLFGHTWLPDIRTPDVRWNTTKDGHILAPTSGEDGVRHYEVCRYYTLDEHTSVPDVLLIGTAAWDRLSDDERAILEQAAREASELQRRLWREATEEALAVVAAAGVEIIRPDQAPFAARVEPLIAEYRADPELAPWIDRIASTGLHGESTGGAKQ